MSGSVYDSRTIPSEQSIKECGYQVVEYLIGELKVDPSRLILYSLFGCNLSRFGHSLGSAVSVFVTVALVERKNIRIAGLILQVIIVFSFVLL